jgi:hypothetical protein
VAQQRAELGQQVLGHAAQRLPRDEHVEVDVGHDVEELEDLVEHAAVLGGGHGDQVEAAVVLEPSDHRGQFDGLGPGPEDH